MEKRNPKKGKKNRKFGRGLRKVQRSRFGSYAALFAASKERKLKRMASRQARLARRAAKKFPSAHAYGSVVNVVYGVIE